MSERHLDPRRLDLMAVARLGQLLQGTVSQDALPRLVSSVCLDVSAGSEVSWSAQPEWRAVKGVAPQLWLHLSARSVVILVCQRCLQPMKQPLVVERSFMFVADEDEAARLDEDSDDDVLVLPKSLDLQTLLEDELILALPIVPRHEACPEPLPRVGAPDDDIDAGPHPFASLAVLRGRAKLN